MTMEFQFNDFDTAHFRADPIRTPIGPWVVEHHSFGTASTAECTPIVFIGGAFQNAWSFMREVKHFLPQRPIILLDMPGQGQNSQLAPDLTFADFADLVDRFLESQGLESVIPVGLSYGSGIACTFARRHPERVESIILCGTAQQIRPRIATALYNSFARLDEGRVDNFADGVVHHLLNLPHRAATNVTDRLVEAIRLGMIELTENERARYRDNSSRLFRERFDSRVSPRMLVCTARHDHFTPPFEGLALASGGAASEFVIIDQGDHLSSIENPRTHIALYESFVNGQPGASVPGVVSGAAAVEVTRERRMLERRPGRRREVSLRVSSGAESRALLLDYNAHGCLLELPVGTPSQNPDELVNVSIPSIGANADAVMMPDARGARAIFVTDAFGTLGTMPVATVEMAIPRASGRRVSVAERIVAIADD
jgi:pimeloyl-ACP methyl ester carboxylesterase